LFQPSDTNPFADHAKYRSGRKIPLPSSSMPKRRDINHHHHRRRVNSVKRLQSVDDDSMIQLMLPSSVAINDDNNRQLSMIPIPFDDDSDNETDWRPYNSRQRSTFAINRHGQLM
jgi:hypothetical protein